MLSDPDIIYSVSIQCQSINTVIRCITAKYFPVQAIDPTVDFLYQYSKKKLQRYKYMRHILSFTLISELTPLIF